ncbi:PREDICTED: extracellular ribonuclease LE-like [Nelumbo nucifera]|uniref:Extracellular ribonuclease LE-like n=2 Tax=Nelumbo nucifera TaxID=4432 RepID=A0A1U7ZYK4_NELNU|nr:PREDICTED: extracellular ribonuclease LE-like [Nelumbo nucifera]DAD38047.1 TPA_asm: hypothetical protein HUJ06_008688 [Nelumbo nucifera]
MASYILPIALVALFMFSTALQTTSIKDLDFYHLVLMWPGSYCKQTSAGCCIPKTGGEPELDFFVKGLLPYSNDGKALTQCGMSPFYLDEISDLNNDLNSYWPNIKCPSSESRHLWKNTWKTYGVCSGLSEHDYFKKALDLRSKIDLLSIFKKHGIISTDYADYSLAEIKQVINREFGATTAISCSKNQWDETQVYEIYLCVDREARNIIPCPVLPNFTCASRVVFGSFTYDMLKNVSSLADNPIRMRIR